MLILEVDVSEQKPPSGVTLSVQVQAELYARLRSNRSLLEQTLTDAPVPDSSHPGADAGADASDPTAGAAASG